MRILVADDDPTSRLIAQIALRGLGHDCVTVNDGQQAWDAFLAEAPDVVISDWMMPGLNGLELCRNIRAHALGRSTYFIMVTRQGALDQILDGMNAGADDYLIKPLDSDDLQARLIAAARVTSLHGQLADQRSELEGMNDELAAIARRDPLTSLANRRALQEDLARLETGVARYGRRYSMALLDVDLFKSYNDAYGHPAGDQVLQTVANHLKAQMRSGDMVYRYGGEEFLCILPEQTLETATAAVQRMLTGLERMAIPHRESPLGVLTISAGIAILGSDRRSAEHVLNDADTALYRAKQLGRNRVEQAEGALVVDPPERRVRDVSVGTTDPSLDRSAPIFALVDRDGTIRQQSSLSSRVLGLEQGASLIDGLDRVDPADLERTRATYQRILASPGVSEHIVLRTLDDKGRWRDLDLIAVNLLDDPAVGAIAITGRDVTDERVLEIERRLESRLLMRMPTSVIVTDDRGVVVYWNDRAESLSGYARADAVGRTVKALDVGPNAELMAALLETVRAVGRWEGEYDSRRADGSTVPVHVCVDWVEDEEIGFRGLVISSLDVSDRRRVEGELAFQALHDPLTGLPNRPLFIDHVAKALERGRQRSRTTAVVFLDLDDFASVNELVGSDGGDDVIRAIGQLITAALRPGDVVARFGGDEFVVCCEDLAGHDEAYEIAQRATAAIETPFSVGRSSVTVSASVGIAVSGSDTTAEELLRNATTAMHAAKNAGKGRTELFDDASHAEARRRHELAAELELALDAGELHTYFQPEVAVAGGELLGFEALVRWLRPDGSSVPPDVFIPIAEDHALIGRIGERVLRDSCRALSSWIEAMPDRPIHVAVNVSVRQLMDPGFPDTVQAIFEETEVPPGRLCLEVTETALADADIAVAALRRLRATGATIAIDDFGTGYSSLSRLHRFPVDYLKIDRAFVSGMTERSEDAVIVSAIVVLAQTLGLRTVAEGVETNAQLTQLRNLGCDIGQGYLWSPAVPAEVAMNLVRANGAVPVSDQTAPVGAPASTMTAPIEALAVSAESDAMAAVAVLVHELSQPITILSGFAEMLATNDDAGLRTRAIPAIQRASRQARAAMDMARDVGAIASGELDVVRAPLALADVVRDAVKTVEELHGLVVEADMPEAVVIGDADRLVAVLLNLLGNAIKHTPAGTAVRVVGELVDDTVTVHVLDDGPGLPAASIGVVFRKFGRASTAAAGSGLGLYFARAIVRAHGGELSYRPVPDGGADFAMELPVAHPAPTFVAAAASAPIGHSVQLYVDDEEIVSSIVELISAADRAGRPALVVATEARRAAILDVLRERGVVIETGSLRMLDAADTLESFLVDGEPDWSRYLAVVGTIVEELLATGTGLSIYGEMVGILWQRGQVHSAVALEGFWNQLGVRLPFELLCGYRVDCDDDRRALDRVCEMHTEMIDVGAVSSGTSINPGCELVQLARG